MELIIYLTYSTVYINTGKVLRIMPGIFWLFVIINNTIIVDDESWGGKKGEYCGHQNGEYYVLYNPFTYILEPH